MKKTLPLLIIASIMLLVKNGIAQSGPNATNPDKKTKVVRGCEYEVLPGLAEIIAVDVTRFANESLLHYDEHEVQFKFTAMEGDEVLEMLKGATFEFHLRSGAASIPVGPEYIKRKNLKVGTKYAMNLLQTKNKAACLDQFTYESKALDNDLFEAEANIIPFIKADYEDQLIKKEQEYNQQQSEKKPEKAFEDSSSIVCYEGLGSFFDENVDITTMSYEEMRTYVEERLKKQQQEGTLISTEKDDLGINIDSLRIATEKELRAQYKTELAAASFTKKASKLPIKNTNKTAIQQARKEAKAQKRAKELAAREKEKREKARQIEIERVKAAITLDVEESIQNEIATKKAIAQRALQEEAEKVEERTKNKEAALARMKVIESEMKDQMLKEAQRKDCVFGERISGVIEVTNVRKVKNITESLLGYAEYEVLVSFRPDSFADLSKKDKKTWEQSFVFTLDSQGVNANPGAGYIRKYRLFKSSKYQGFVQQLSTGVCNDVLMYSPDLPIDANQLSTGQKMSN